MSTRIVSVAVACTAAVALMSGVAHGSSAGGLWTSAGQDLSNTRYQQSEKRIGVDSVADLAVKWVATTGGDVSATPAVDGSRVYVPDWAGNLYAFNRDTGALVWRVRIADATGIPGDKARATPAVAEGKVFIGTQGPFGGGGRMLAYDKDTGALLWSTAVDAHPAAIITQSASVHNGRVYVGVSSLEEAMAAFIPNYPCCSFRGSMAALDAGTGQLLWKTIMVPEGYPGGAVWGSSPAIDPVRNQVYIATGNNYDIPQEALDCVEAAAGNPDAEAACIDPANLMDAVVALNLDTGRINWVTKALPFDAWTVQCLFGSNPDNCPEPAGPDYDFGQAPALYTAKVDGRPRQLLGTGQKSGQYWALDPDDGRVVWVTTTGPGGTAGGLQWGSAVDGRRVYTANANTELKPWLMPDGTTVTSGMWSGLDAATGELLWQTAPTHGGGASGPATTANGVVFGCALDPQGWMYALEAATGDILWEFASGGSCLSGAAISRGNVYWGSGYVNLGGTPNNKLYAFAIP